MAGSVRGASFHYIDDVINTCPLHLHVTHSRGWSGGDGDLLGYFRRWLIRASFDVDPVDYLT